LHRRLGGTLHELLAVQRTNVGVQATRARVSVNIQDVPKNSTCLDYLEDKLNLHSYFNPTPGSQQFFEFPLSVLGALTPESLLDETLTIERSIGLSGWRTTNGESTFYKGFSLTHNPNLATSPHFQTLGDQNLAQTFSRTQGTFTEELRDTYYDTYSFYKSNGFYQDMMANVKLQQTRGRVSYLIADGKQDLTQIGYHRDEFIFQNLRINIPLQTEECHRLEIKGTDEYGNTLHLDKHLEVGKAYVWNTRIPHRVYCTSHPKLLQPRIHIVLGLMPWIRIEEDTGEITKNQFFGRDPFELLASGELFESPTTV
jgi:hypothetical protein